MIYGIKVIIKYLLGTDKAERNFAVYPDDTFLVSYPRSGNTWTRFLIANLVHPEKNVSFKNIEKLIPDTSSQSNQALKRTPRPRIIKTHQYFDHRYPKTIYIVRDPRDIALSYYDFQRKYMQINNDYPLERYVDDPRQAFMVRNLRSHEIRQLRSAGLTDEPLRAIDLAGIGTDELNYLLVNGLPATGEPPD